VSARLHTICVAGIALQLTVATCKWCSILRPCDDLRERQDPHSAGARSDCDRLWLGVGHGDADYDCDDHFGRRVEQLFDFEDELVGFDVCYREYGQCSCTGRGTGIGRRCCGCRTGDLRSGQFDLLGPSCMTRFGLVELSVSSIAYIQTFSLRFAMRMSCPDTFNSHPMQSFPRPLKLRLSAWHLRPSRTAHPHFHTPGTWASLALAKGAASSPQSSLVSLAELIVQLVQIHLIPKIASI
jgi:hypothetical protein